MNSNTRVLVVSQDEMLLRTRELILGAFFKVQGAGRVSEAKLLIQNKIFDLIVFCHSVTEAECEQLVDLAQDRSPRPLILAMNSNGRNSSKPWADRQLGVDAGPYGLLKECAEMLGFVLKSKAKAASHM
jgi:DNA-binding NtrC family response regulator